MSEKNIDELNNFLYSNTKNLYNIMTSNIPNRPVVNLIGYDIPYGSSFSVDISNDYCTDTIFHNNKNKLLNTERTNITFYKPDYSKFSDEIKKDLNNYLFLSVINKDSSVSPWICNPIEDLNILYALKHYKDNLYKLVMFLTGDGKDIYNIIRYFGISKIDILHGGMEIKPTLTYIMLNFNQNDMYNYYLEYKKTNKTQIENYELNYKSMNIYMIVGIVLLVILLFFILYKYLNKNNIYNRYKYKVY